MIVGRLAAVPDDLVVEPLVERLARRCRGSARHDRDPAMGDGARGLRGRVRIRADAASALVLSTVDDLDHFRAWWRPSSPSGDLADGVVGHYGLGDGRDVAAAAAGRRDRTGRRRAARRSRARRRPRRCSPPSAASPASCGSSWSPPCSARPSSATPTSRPTRCRTSSSSCSPPARSRPCSCRRSSARFDRGDDEEAERLAGSVLGLALAGLGGHGRPRCAGVALRHAPAGVRRGRSRPCATTRSRWAPCFLLVFLPQIVLYDVGLVATGVAPRRRPLRPAGHRAGLNNLVVCGAYGAVLVDAAGRGPGPRPVTPPRSRCSPAAPPSASSRSAALPIIGARRTGFRFRPNLDRSHPALRAPRPARGLGRAVPGHDPGLPRRRPALREPGCGRRDRLPGRLHLLPAAARRCSPCPS